MECNGKRFFGPGPAELLELISDTGSISKASKKMRMSYKKSWQIIDSLNKGTQQPFVTTQIGGSNGGGSLATDDAKAVILWYRKLRERFTIFLNKETASLNKLS